MTDTVGMTIDLNEGYVVSLIVKRYVVMDVEDLIIYVH